MVCSRASTQMMTKGVYFHTFSRMAEAIAMLGVESQAMFSEISPAWSSRWFTTPISLLKIQRQLSAITTVGTM